MIIPPFAGVRLIEFQDRIELTPIYWYREFVGLGRCKASLIAPASEDEMRPFYDAIMGDQEIWVVAVWKRFEDGRDEAIQIQYLDPQATEAEAYKAFEQMNRFMSMTRKEMEALSQCFQVPEEDLDYIEKRFFEVKDRPSVNQTDEYDLYQARLQVIAGMLPETVALIKQANDTEDPVKRQKIEKEAVEAYFAEMAHYWTEDLVKAWQKTNPIGTEWMCVFGRVFQEPKLELDPINHELVLNWLRRKYNLLTAEELSDAILIATQQRVTPGTIKKRRERFGLTTKRRPGPRGNDGQ